MLSTTRTASARRQSRSIGATRWYRTPTSLTHRVSGSLGFPGQCCSSAARRVNLSDRQCLSRSTSTTSGLSRSYSNNSDILKDAARYDLIHVASCKDSSVRIYCTKNPRNKVCREYTYNGETKCKTEDKPLDGYSALWVSSKQQSNLQKISNSWLRDHCNCSSCINQETRQRRLLSFTPEVLEAKIQAVSWTSNTVIVDWADGHRSIYEKDWMFSWTQGSLGPSESLLEHEPEDWDPDIDIFAPKVNFKELVQEGKGMSKLMRTLRTVGFCFIRDTPATAEATKSVLERIGPVRSTHYGGFYDFTADLSSKDTAYTAEHLAPHNDTTYFTDPVGLQAFHILSHTSPKGGSGEGGATTLVDGFRAARELTRRQREILTRVKIHAHSSGNEGVHVRTEEPFGVLEYGEEADGMKRVRWNNDDRVGFARAAFQYGADAIDEWYEAAARFNALLNTPDPRWWKQFQLAPGRLLIFDNWRVLHGRTAFSGKRRMCGAYISRDDYISKWKTSMYDRATLQTYDTC